MSVSRILKPVYPKKLSFQYITYRKHMFVCNALSRVVRKPAFCICENKDADQLRGNREADQLLCFRHTDSTLPLLSKSEISSLWPSSVTVQPGLCQTWSETPKTGFLRTRLHSSFVMIFLSTTVRFTRVAKVMPHFSLN